MSTVETPHVATRSLTLPAAHRGVRFGTRLISFLATTDHKVLGTLYFVTTMAFFIFGGILALLVRAELAFPGLQYLHYERYNQVFTMHGTIMLLMFATPLFAGFANWLLPLQLGAPDMAFPRLNAFAYWLYLFGSLMACAGFLTPTARRPSGGSPTCRCLTPSTPPASAATSGCSASTSWGWGRSSAR